MNHISSKEILDCGKTTGGACIAMPPQDEARAQGKLKVSLIERAVREVCAYQGVHKEETRGRKRKDLQTKRRLKPARVYTDTSEDDPSFSAEDRELHKHTGQTESKMAL